MNRIPVGISSCLLGNPVRYDGSHKYDAFCVERLSTRLRLEPFCPEVAIGMGVPRKPIRLVASSAQEPEVLPRALGVDDPDRDVTEGLLAYADAVAKSSGHLRGYLFMPRSPSCGLQGAALHLDDGTRIARHSGLFAGRLRQHWPLLPMEDVDRLQDSARLHHFIVRVWVCNDWYASVEDAPDAGALVAFHSRHKYLVMACNPVLYRDLGRSIAQAGTQPAAALAETYIQRLMAAIAPTPDRGGHVNVLLHMAGYLRGKAPVDRRRALVQAIDAYREGWVPLAVPMAHLQQALALGGNDYLCRQSYVQGYGDWPVKGRLQGPEWAANEGIQSFMPFSVDGA